MKNFQEKPDWSDFENKWLSNYDSTNYGKGLSSSVLKKTHSLIERDARLNDHYDVVLEIGAGTMAHFPRVRHGFDRYIASDNNANVVDWLRRQDWDDRVEVQKISGSALPYADESIDRVIATHVLEHVADPLDALHEWVRVLKPGGVLSLILPCDPGILWRTGRAFGPRRQGIKAGLPYDYYMAVEHRNPIHNLRHIVDFHFPDRVETWWPFKIANPDANLVYCGNC